MLTGRRYTDEERAAARERNLRKAREAVAARRAAMTPEERAAQRRGWDAAYREAHRWERRLADRAYRERKRAGG